MTKHTPTPYHVIKRGQLHIIGGNGSAVCHLEAQINPKETEANAAFIVRACNSHDGLVKAVENILQADGDLYAMDFDQLRAALKVAKE